jgi:molecular chaperone HscB
LNDAYRVLRSLPSRVEYLLTLEGLPPVKATESSARVAVPPALLEEVFALNEELDEIRAAREGGADPAGLRERLATARRPIDEKREQHERQLLELSARWDAQAAAPADQKRQTLEALREQLLERNYINNLLAAIEREGAALG